MFATAARLMALILFLSWIPAVVLAYFLTPAAILIAFFVTAMALAGLAARTTALILREIKAFPLDHSHTDPAIQEGFRRSLERISQEYPAIAIPNLHLYSEPTPHALLTKSCDGQVHLAVARGAQCGGQLLPQRR
ncbi:MAG: hypothetical protein AAB425_13230, partial [Bdellovibrionota bacterium]